MGVSELERSVAQWLCDLPTWTTPIWRTVMQSGTRLAVVVVALGLVLLGRRAAAVTAAVGGFGAWAASTLLKDVVERDRPTAASLGRAMRDVVEGPAFPSSHAAIAAALAAALLLALPLPRWAQVAVVALALATAVARVHVTAHWPLDVAGGLAVGAAVAGITGAAVRRFA